MGRQSGFSMAAILVLGILLTAGSSAGSVWQNVVDSPPVFGGDLCWTIKINQGENGPEVNPPMPVKFHIVSLDPTTFVMTGAVIPPDGDTPFIMTGTATLRGTSIIANLIGTQDHKINDNGNLWRDATILRTAINTTTLNGTVFLIGQSFNRTNHTFDNEDYAAGTLTYRNCP